MGFANFLMMLSFTNWQEGFEVLTQPEVIENMAKTTFNHLDICRKNIERSKVWATIHNFHQFMTYSETKSYAITRIAVS